MSVIVCKKMSETDKPHSFKEALADKKIIACPGVTLFNTAELSGYFDL